MGLGLYPNKCFKAIKPNLVIDRISHFYEEVFSNKNKSIKIRFVLKYIVPVSLLKAYSIFK